MTSATTKSTERNLKDALQTNSEVAQWGLLKVYRNQNEYEQQTGQCSESDGQGFTKIDSEILSSISRFLLNRGFLTTKQMAVVHKCMPKYWRQIAEGLSPNELQLVLHGMVSWDTPAGRVMDKYSAVVTNSREVRYAPPRATDADVGDVTPTNRASLAGVEPFLKQPSL